MLSFRSALLSAWTFLAVLAAAQTSAGYVGYELDLEGDKDSVIFSTDETRPNAGANFPDPDVYLNASGMLAPCTFLAEPLTMYVYSVCWSDRYSGPESRE